MNKQRFIMVVKGISKEGKSIGIAVKAMLLLILLAPYFAYSSGDYPGENVRLTGKSYFYPTGLEGSPYLHDDWQIASITLENGSVAIGEKVKLNIITNDLIFYNEELKRVFVIDKRAEYWLSAERQRLYPGFEHRGFKFLCEAFGRCN